MALPVFHSFTSYDSTSVLFGEVKKLAWDAWNSFSDITDAFLFIGSHPHTLLSNENEHFKLIERYCIVMCDKTRNTDP